MTKPRGFSAVIFDMDGLVLETESTYRIAWQAAAKSMGHSLSDNFLLSLSGLNYQEVVQNLTAECGADFKPQTFNHAANCFWRDYVAVHGIKTRPGFTELLEFIIAQRKPFCLATNSRAVNVEECLDLAGIKTVFSTIITRDDVANGKPAPDIFLKAAQLLQVPINKCLVLEDSPTGIAAAAKAGAITVWVPSAPPVDPQTLALCDLVMPDLVETLATLRLEKPFKNGF
ncbi:MAG: HAD family phosphatase [Methylovulum sp.]|nr:HAD family phosphatase [Methylovulum sp.]